MLNARQNNGGAVVCLPVLPAEARRPALLALASPACEAWCHCLQDAFKNPV